MESQSTAILVQYRHPECLIDSTIEWYDVWSCACNGQCPACGIKDIEPNDWEDAASCFGASTTSADSDIAQQSE